MYVSKEEAKKMIDNAPGKIWIDTFNDITFVHTRPKVITIEEGKEILGRASAIDFQDNDFFALLSLKGVQTLITHNIQFPLALKE